MKRVVVHVERLVLMGFRHEQRHGIASGLQQELARAFGDGAFVRPSSLVTDASAVSAGAVRVGQDSLAQQIGADVARELYKAIRK